MQISKLMTSYTEPNFDQIWQYLGQFVAEICLIIISLCITFDEPFNNIFLFIKSSCALVSGNTNKRLQPKERRNDGLTDWANNDEVSEFTLSHLTPISHSAK